MRLTKFLLLPSFLILTNCVKTISPANIEEIGANSNNKPQIGFLLKTSNPNKIKYLVRVNLLEKNTGKKIRLETETLRRSKEEKLVIFEVPKGEYLFQSTGIRSPSFFSGGFSWSASEIENPQSKVGPYWDNTAIKIDTNELIYGGTLNSHFDIKISGNSGSYKANSYLFTDEDSSNLKNLISAKKLPREKSFYWLQVEDLNLKKTTLSH